VAEVSTKSLCNAFVWDERMILTFHFKDRYGVGARGARGARGGGGGGGYRGGYGGGGEWTD
jgi:hypothetical protein